MLESSEVNERFCYILLLYMQNAAKLCKKYNFWISILIRFEWLKHISRNCLLNIGLAQPSVSTQSWVRICHDWSAWRVWRCCWPAPSGSWRARWLSSCGTGSRTGKCNANIFWAELLWDRVSNWKMQREYFLSYHHYQALIISNAALHGTFPWTSN